MNNRGRVYRLYQWLSCRARFSRSGSAIGDLSRTVRTEITIERQQKTLLIGGASADLDHCPLCGQTLAMAQGEQARLLEGDSTTHPCLPAEREPT